MKKFKYTEVRYSWSNVDMQKLNDLGDDGWELVAVTQEFDGTEREGNLRAIQLRYTFKKRVDHGTEVLKN